MNLPGISRPLRAAGLALVGVAVVALAIGTVTVVTGDADEAAAPSGEQTTTTAPGEGDGGESPTSTPGSPSETEPGSATESDTATSEPEDGSGDGSDSGDGAGDGAGDGDGGGDGKATGVPDGKGDMGSGKDGPSLQEMVDVRVYNNSEISGLASRASRDLEARGWDVVETGNYSDGVIYTTTAYYRPGTNEEAAAQAIGENYSMRVKPRFEGIKDASPGVIVIVTKDYEGRKTSK